MQRSFAAFRLFLVALPCLGALAARPASAQISALLGWPVSPASAQIGPGRRPAPTAGLAPPAVNQLRSVRALTAYIARLKADDGRRTTDDGRIPDRDSPSRRGRDRWGSAAAQASSLIPHPSSVQEDAGTDFLEAYLYRLQQRAYPNDTVDPTAWARATMHRNGMAPAHIQVNGVGIQALGTWQPLGPNNLDVPYTIYWGPSPVSGRIGALAFDYSDPTESTFYAGAAGGGVWQTFDGGNTWTPLSDNWPTLEVSSIALDPTNPSTIYVGTGDFDGYWVFASGIGLMKSTDGGATWTNLGQAQFGQTAVKSILVDPDNPQIVTVATGRGQSYYGWLWRSTDGGLTWNAVNTNYAAWDSLRIGAPDPVTGQRYYYAGGAAYGGLVYRSADRGATWTRLFPPVSGSFQYYMTLAASPTDPNTVYLIASTDQAIFKSTNAGASWVNITAGFPTGGGYNWSQYYYDVFLDCSTRTDASGNPHDVLYVGLIDVVQSIDGGATWRSIGGPTYTYNALTHNDQHGIAINPADPNAVLIGNDGGAYLLNYNPVGDAWNWTDLNAALTVTQFYHMDAHPTDPNQMLGGTQDNATPVSTGDLTHWLNRGGGDGSGVAINTANPNIQYATAQNFNPLYRTTDDWASETTFTPSFGGDRIPFTGFFTVDPNSPNLLYLGTNYLWRWNESTLSWTGRLGGQPLSSSSTVDFIAVAPGDGNRIYTGSNDGQLWMTTGAGAAGSWSQINTGLTSLPNRAITSVSVNPGNENDILAGLSGTGAAHLWRCTNTTAGAARTWINVSGTGATGLPDIPLNTIARDITDPANTWFVGTDVGVFYTTNGGATWTNATNPLGLPNVEVDQLISVPGTGYLNAATYGRGIWNIQLNAP